MHKYISVEYIIQWNLSNETKEVTLKQTNFLIYMVWYLYNHAHYRCHENHLSWETTKLGCPLIQVSCYYFCPNSCLGTHSRKCLWAHNWNNLKIPITWIYVLVINSGYEFACLKAAQLLWHLHNCNWNWCVFFIQGVLIFLQNLDYELIEFFYKLSHCLFLSA